MGQEAKLRILCRYFHNERKKFFNNIFTDEIKNIIIEYNFFVVRSPNENGILWRVGGKLDLLGVQGQCSQLSN